MIINYNNTDVAVLVKQHEIEKSVVYDLTLPDKKTELEITIFKFHRILTDDNSVGSNVEITQSLNFVNHFLKSLKVKYNFQQVREVSRVDFPQISPVRFYTTLSFKEKHIKDIDLENCHFNNLPPLHPELKGNEITNFAEFVATNENNPYVHPMYHLRISTDLVQTGNYSFRVISLQTGIEMFIYTLLSEKLDIEETDPLKKENSLSNTPYKNILNDHLRPMFKDYGYEFDYDSESKENLLKGYKKIYIYYETKLYTVDIHA